MLWEADPSIELRQLLQTRALAWLDAVSIEHGGWKFVWESLWQTDPSEPLQILALKWLEDVSLENNDWPFIWQLIVNKYDLKPEVRNRMLISGRLWLENTRLAHRSRPYMYGFYTAITPDFDSYLVNSGFTWLGQQSIPNSSWYLVWCPLWDNCPERHKELGDIALRIQAIKQVKEEGYNKIRRRLGEGF